jgi:hypothetical protein
MVGEGLGEACSAFQPRAETDSCRGVSYEGGWDRLVGQYAAGVELTRSGPRAGGAARGRKRELRLGVERRVR